MGAHDLALGNVFGSNSFNIAMLAILDLFQSGPLLSQVAPVNALTGLAVILVTSVAVVGQLYKVETRRALFEPDAILIIALVLGSLGMVYAFS